MKTLKVGNVDVLLDDWDWLRLCRYKWRVKGDGKCHKSIARTVRKDGLHFTIYMHREVMQTPLGMECHHKKGNTFDNRKEMLENLTKEEHMVKDRELGNERESEVPF